ncbi:hypothetical protein UA08_05833 [Talaromyces atroroseus]|uniref:MYB DNA-binding domain protein n=1 Tax=Talaromyces atroroseus TaxID=1441469 RepID=A0A225AW41_TALAT|nr:hypothetical protein UA08_05833 [Talaromyces atroroseus]OKL59176.1 hypothetical protein UA08_05833 [Talaromyces atroroseus]
MLLLHQPINPISSPAKVDISLLLKPDDEEEEKPLPQGQLHRPSSSSSAASSRRPSMLGRGTETGVGTGNMPSASTSTSAAAAKPNTTSPISTIAGTKRHSSSSLGNEPPAKKQSKWSPEEDTLIIELRGRGMKWEDISKRLPGRSAISCRLHYQNYLERRSEWDEDRKNKLARLYERFKAEMWAKVAEEMAIPWRAAEAMHWQLGEQEMARRAGVVPFSLSSGSSSVEPPPKLRRHTTVMPRLRRQSMSVTSAIQPAPPPPPPPLGLVHGAPAHAVVHPTPFVQSLPQPLPPLPQQPAQPVQPQPQLPSVEELTAGVPAYTSPVTQPIIDPYRSRPPQLPLPHPPPPDMSGMSPPQMIPRTRP